MVVAALAFVGIFFLNMPFPLLILLAALYGFWAGDARADPEGGRVEVKAKPLRTVATIVLWLAIWWVPLLSIAFLGNDTILAEIGWFFSKLAVVTFGGAYAVLAYMAQDVVVHFGFKVPHRKALWEILCQDTHHPYNNTVSCCLY